MAFLIIKVCALAACSPPRSVCLCWICLTQNCQLANEVWHEMWVWIVASPHWRWAYPPACNVALFSAWKSCNFRPCPTVEPLFCERQHDLATSGFILPFRHPIVTFQCSQNGLKPPVMWLGQSVMLMDSRHCKMRRPLLHHEITAEIMSLTLALWELRDLLTLCMGKLKACHKCCLPSPRPCQWPGLHG